MKFIIKSLTCFILLSSFCSLPQPLHPINGLVVRKKEYQIQKQLEYAKAYGKYT